MWRVARTPTACGRGLYDGISGRRGLLGPRRPDFPAPVALSVRSTPSPARTGAAAHARRRTQGNDHASCASRGPARSPEGQGDPHADPFGSDHHPRRKRPPHDLRLCGRHHVGPFLRRHAVRPRRPGERGERRLHPIEGPRSTRALRRLGRSGLPGRGRPAHAASNRLRPGGAPTHHAAVRRRGHGFAGPGPQRRRRDGARLPAGRERPAGLGAARRRRGRGGSRLGGGVHGGQRRPRQPGCHRGRQPARPERPDDAAARHGRVPGPLGGVRLGDADRGRARRRRTGGGLPPRAVLVDHAHGRPGEDLQGARHSMRRGQGRLARQADPGRGLGGRGDRIAGVRAERRGRGVAAESSPGSPGAVHRDRSRGTASVPDRRSRGRDSPGVRGGAGGSGAGGQPDCGR